MKEIFHRFQRRRQQSELDLEIETHLQERIDELTEAGMSQIDARHQTIREFGNVIRIREDAREVWTWRWLNDALWDLRYAFRDLQKSPGFWFGAAVILSLGIGVNVAAFQLLDAVFWPPQIREPESLVRFFAEGSESPWLAAVPLHRPQESLIC